MLYRHCVELLQLSAVGLLLGWLLGYPLPVLVCVYLAYALWLTVKLHRIDQWLNQWSAAVGVDQSLERSSGHLFDRLIRHRARQTAVRFRLLRLLAQSRRMIEVFSDPVVVVDDALQVIWVNLAARKLFRLQWPQERHRPLLNLMRDQQVNKALIKLDADHPYFYRRFQLSAHPQVVFRAHLHYLRPSNKMIHLQDASEIEGLMHSQRQLLVNFSHELRTPLTLIRGYTDIIEENTDQQHERLQRIRELVERINRFSQDNLTNMRAVLKQQNSDIPLIKVDVARWCRDYLNDCRLAGQLRHPVQVEIEDGLVVAGRLQDMDSIFSNLINNAREHTPEGTEITVRGYRQYDQVIFEVEDRGAGIDERHIDHLTEPFYRPVDHDRDLSSDDRVHGMGLPIVDNLLRRYHGRLIIQSTLGKGSLFRCRIPIESVSASAPQRRATSE